MTLSWVYNTLVSAAGYILVVTGVVFLIFLIVATFLFFLSDDFSNERESVLDFFKNMFQSIYKLYHYKKLGLGKTFEYESLIEKEYVHKHMNELVENKIYHCDGNYTYDPTFDIIKYKNKIIPVKNFERNILYYYRTKVSTKVNGSVKERLSDLENNITILKNIEQGNYIKEIKEL